MRVVVINTGTEILLGSVLNTHLTFIAREILPLGLRVEEQRTVPDGAPINGALAEAFKFAEIVFITGGLGPTTDDITRESVAELLHLKLKHDDAVMTAINERMRLRNFQMTDRIPRQALVPDGAQVLPNEHGTAPGFYLAAGVSRDIASPHLFVLPGPPRELKPMFRDKVFPILRKLVPTSNAVTHRTFRLARMGESLVEAAVGKELTALPGLELGYCARPGEVDVRIIGSQSVVEQAEKIIRAKLEDFIFATEDEELEEVVVRMLAARGETLALAESCTGGFLANRITNVPGASKIFVTGFVTYSNASKSASLGVDAALIEKHGAVSEEVARAMAEGAMRKGGTSHALATTGIAGPAGGSAEKPTGTVFVSLASDDRETVVEKLFFPSDRETFKRLVAQAAFDLLRRRIR